MDLSPPAQRVLGCLVEKALATPQQYPLTLNSLRTACNQTTGREPVVDYDDNTVEAALAELREPRLVRTEVVKGSRTPKYSHRLESELGFDQRDHAVVALLLLRGPQTEGEINSRSGRLYEFSSLEEVDEALASLAARGHVERLERRPGEKAQRWRHRLGPGVGGDRPEREPAQTTVADPPPGTHQTSTGATSASPDTDQLAVDVAALRERIQELEGEVARLRERLDAVDRPTPGLP